MTTISFCSNALLQRLRTILQMPLHDLLEDALSPGLNHIPVARYNSIERPSIDLLHTLAEGGSGVRQSIPYNSLLCQSRTSRVLQTVEQLGQQAGRRVHIRLTELFGCWQVEQQVSFDKGARLAVIEDEFLVAMRMDIFIVEVGVELG